jgi:hypothetical protein
MKTAAPSLPELALLESIVERAFAQTQHMIYVANNRKDKQPRRSQGRRHPASCASSMHVLARCTCRCASRRTTSAASRTRRRSTTRCTT